MRILMLIPATTIRGPIPKFVLDLVRGMGDEGCQVECHIWGRHNDADGLLRRVLGRCLDVKDISRILRGTCYDLVLVHTAHDWATLSRDIPLLLLNRHMSRRTILHLHGSRADVLGRPGNLIFKYLSGFLVNLVRGVLLLSKEEKRQWEQFAPCGRFAVVRNPMVRLGVAPPESRAPWNSIVDGRLIILFAGRLIREKGICDLIRAMNIVKTKVDACLVVAGDGPLQPKVRDLTKQFGLDNSIIFAGYLEGEMLSLAYNQADIFVLPTYWHEGFPSVISEAMGVGLPIITTMIRGQVDYLTENQNAIFIRPQDEISLADAMVGLLRDSKLRERMGIANLEKVKLFDAETVARDYVRVVTEIISGE